MLLFSKEKVMYQLCTMSSSSTMTTYFVPMQFCNRIIRKNSNKSTIFWWTDHVSESFAY